MVGFKKEQRGENTFLTYTVEEGKLDLTVSNMLTRNHIAGLLPYSATQVDRERICSYNITSKVTLQQYFSRPVKKESLIKVFQGILDAVDEAGEYLLRPDDMLFDSEAIYVSVSDGVPALICLPAAREEKGDDLLTFCRKLMLETSFDESEDRSYVADLLDFMKRPEAARYSEFRRRLEEMKGTAPAPRRRPAPQPVIPAAPISPVPQPMAPVEPVAPIVPPAVPETMEEPKEEKKWFGFLGGGKKEKKPAKEKKGPKEKKQTGGAPLGFQIPGVDPDPVAVDPGPSAPAPASVREPAAVSGGHGTSAPAPFIPPVDLVSEETVVMGSGGILGRTGGAPWLVQVRTGKTVQLGRFPFRLGKEASYVDFCVEGNAAVSRSHADIQQEDGSYTLTDNNSKNHTFVDGQRLQPGQPYPILPGTHFFLANEEFIFELR